MKIYTLKYINTIIFSHLKTKRKNNIVLLNDSEKKLYFCQHSNFAQWINVGY